MNKPEQGFRHLDLPVDWLEKSGGWVPPKSRNQQETAEFKKAPAGNVIFKRQSDGIAVAAHMLDFMAEGDVDSRGALLIATAGLVSAWHSLAEGVTNRMRKVTYLPVHIDSAQPIDRQQLTDRAAQSLHQAAGRAVLLSREFNRSGSLATLAQREVGYAASGAALALASVPYAEYIARSSGDDQTMQYYARLGALDARSQAQTIRSHIGVYPSLAQLGVPFAPLPVHIQNEGDKLTRDALEYGQEMVFGAEAA